MLLHSKVWKSFTVICLCLAGVAVMLACATEQKEEAMSSAPEPLEMAKSPTSHVWDCLQKEKQEVPGYGMYTYVLFGRRVEGLVQTNPEVLERYKQVIQAITGSTLTSGEARPIKKNTNIFYIPSKKPEVNQKFDVTNYNSGLAMSYINRLAGMILNHPDLQNRLRTRPGPFLVSTQYPLGALKAGTFPLLYADLSDSNPGSMGETIAAYKSYTCEPRTEGVDRFNPLRLLVLNFFLNLDDDIQIVKVAAAEWLPD